MKNKLDQDIERKRLTKENCKIADFPLILLVVYHKVPR